MNVVDPAIAMGFLLTESASFASSMRGGDGRVKPHVR
jgi:hypothetical protein